MPLFPRPDPGAVKAATNEATRRILQKIRRLGMTPRQQQLNALWAHYQCCQYDARKIGWDGSEIVDRVSHEAIASQGFVPPGFYDAGAAFPLQFRKPSAPYNLYRVIVDRFTGMLFSERRHPKLRVENNPEAEQLVADLAEVARLWPAAIMARTYGGATGTVAMGFQFINGKPVVEVHDPRWIFPQWKDRFALKLSGIEKRMMYPVEQQNEKGDWETVWYWYRRVIDEQSDTVFKPAKVDDEEPDWQIDSQVVHNFGFCPVVWIQNLPMLDEIDGVEDCHGTLDLIFAIDCLLSQAHKGVVSNCDPTLILVSDAQMAAIKKGSDNALKLPPNSEAKYLEISGTGPDAAQKLGEQLRKLVLEVSQCVIEAPDVQNRTAYEVDRAYESMRSKSDILREQYGEKGIKPLLNMMLKGAQKMSQGSLQNGTIVRGGLSLVQGKPLVLPQFGQAVEVQLQWPRYFEPALTDIQVGTTAANLAKAGGLIDQEHASKFVADFFKVEDVQEMLQNIKAEAPDLAAMSLQGLRGGAPGAGGLPKPPGVGMPPGASGAKAPASAPSPGPRVPAGGGSS